MNAWHLHDDGTWWFGKHKGANVSDRIEVYMDGAGGWRWKRVAGNNEIISAGESHTSRHDAIRAARRANPGDIEYQLEAE